MGVFSPLWRKDNVSVDMRRVVVLVLAVLAAVLAYLLVESIMAPIRFERDKDARYAACIERLKQIRELQVAFRSENHHYTASFDSLIAFGNTDSFRVVRQVGSLDDSLAVAEGRVRRDTISVSVRDSLFAEGMILDSLRFVPFTGGRSKFGMDAGKLTTASKVTVQVFECRVSNRVLLEGLDHQSIVNMDDVAQQLGRYPGLMVGSMVEATNNAGNWE